VVDQQKNATVPAESMGLSENDEKTTKNPQVEPYVSMKIREAIKQNGISKPIFVFWTN